MPEVKLAHEKLECKLALDEYRVLKRVLPKFGPAQPRRIVLILRTRGFHEELI